MANPHLSFVIPAKDEEKSIKPLYQEIKKTAGKLGKTFEIIFIDDGSTDKTFENLKKLQKKDKRVKVIRLRGNWGKSVGYTLGFEKATGYIIFTMDADLQDDAAEIPKFLEKLNDGYDLVVGWKRKRQDPFTKTLPSRTGNALMRLLTGVGIHDLNSGYRAAKSEVFKNLNLYGDIFRFIPVLVAKENYKVAEVRVRHRPRRFGKTKYGWERNAKGLLDLITVVFLAGYVRRPGHFFGTFGLISFFFGFLIGLYITYLRVTTGSIQFRHPLLFLGVLLMIIGIQLITTGLLAEMIVYSKQRLDYSSSVKEALE